MTSKRKQKNTGKLYEVLVENVIASLIRREFAVHLPPQTEIVSVPRNRS